MERLANASSRDECMIPSTTNMEDLGVVTPLVTAERDRDPFFCRDSSYSLHMRCPSSWEFLHIFNNYF